MRLLVTGANGQIGWELSRRLQPFGEIIPLHRNECDFAQPARLPAIIRRIRPDVIINAAAYTSVDKAEQEQELAFVINCDSVGVMAEEARRAGALLIHYSTDYVFDGNKSTPYTEEDKPCPINAYGRSKLAGETAIRQVADAFLILRTSWVYAEQRRNFLRTILASTDKRELSIVSDQVGAPTWARDIADATTSIVQTAMRQRTEGRFASGLFNLTASGEVSRYGFAQAIFEIAKARGLLCGRTLPQLRPISTKDSSSGAPRPQNSRLACGLIQDRFAVRLPEWEHALALCLAQIQRKAATEER